MLRHPRKNQTKMEIEPKKSIPKVAQETLLIESFIESQPLGATLLYNQIQKETGVKMDLRGKQFVRSALRRLKYEYESIHNHGIRLFSPDNATRIVVNKLVKVDNAVKRSEKTHKNISQKFLGELTEPEQRQMTFVGAIFGAIRASAKQGKTYFTNQKPREIANNKPIQI
jgi:hypothetical protein